MSRTPNADAVSGYIAGTNTRTVPEPVLEAARMCLVDWFGVAIAARDEGAAQVVRQVAGGRTGSAKVLFGPASDEPYAALINGTMAHCLDFDDTHVGSLAHLSGPTWAAALAVGTATKARPSDMLRGFITGFEVGARIGGNGLGDALNTRTLHSTGFCGCFAAAAAAGALYRLDAAQALNAIGAAATQASGLTGSFGTMSKPFHAGKAAFNGVLSAQLAKAGFIAAHDLIEAGTGLSAAMIQDRSRAIAPVTFPADDWEILRNTFKPYASCLLTHPVIDSARKARGQIAGRAIASIQINVHPMAVQLAGNPAPQTPLQGKFSTAYCAALALSGRAAAAPDFSAERLNDPELRDLVARVRLNVVPGMEKTAASIAVTLADGSTVAADTPLALGNPGNPMQWDDLRSKFFGLVEPVLGGKTERVFGKLHHFGAGDTEDVFTELGGPAGNASIAWTGTYETLPVGESVSCSQVIDGAAIDAFGHSIQSLNPLHMDGDWAQTNTNFPDRIAHGVMTAALMSRPMVQLCERFGVRTALLSSSAKYLKPVIVGDRITTTVRLAEKIDEKRRIRFEIESRNQHGEVVLIGEAMEKAL